MWCVGAEVEPLNNNQSFTKQFINCAWSPLPTPAVPLRQSGSWQFLSFKTMLLASSFLREWEKEEEKNKSRGSIRSEFGDEEEMKKKQDEGNEEIKVGGGGELRGLGRSVLQLSLAPTASHT